jgi:outer membrane protein assembly factor BamA
MKFAGARPYFLWISFAAFLLAALQSCSPTRRLKPNEYLLKKQSIFEAPPSERYADNIGELLSPPPNKKLFGIWRFYLQLHELPNPEKVAQKRAQLDARRDSLNVRIRQKNEHRVKAGKSPKKLKSESPTFNEWLMKIGEAPVILDSSRVERNKKQLQQFLKNHGYFQAQVQDSIVFNPKGKKAEVIYVINRGPAYKINRINSDIEDPTLDWLNEKHRYLSRFNLKPGEEIRFDLDAMDAERERLSSIFRNAGYYLMDKNDILFWADTLKQSEKVELTLTIANPNARIAYKGDSITLNHHPRFIIGNVRIATHDGIDKSGNQLADSLQFNDFSLHFNRKPEIRPRPLSRSLYVHRGGLYHPRNEERTRTALNDLKIFRYVHLRFKPSISGERIDTLNAEIELAPLAHQSISTDLQGTNTDGNLGVSLGAAYTNRNIFKGAEILEFRINAGAEIQVLQGDSLNVKQAGIPFNTLELGGQLSLSTPRFLAPFSLSKWAKPRTRALLSLNYQNRPDYDRTVSTFLFGYEWLEPPSKKPWVNRNYSLFYQVNLAEISLININKTAAFEQFLEQTGDLFVKNSFRQHYIQATSLTVSFSRNSRRKNGPRLFTRFNVQAGGNLLSLGYQLFSPQSADTLGQFSIFGIRFAQYFRSEVDMRYFFPIAPKFQFAFRGFIGFGRAFGNTQVLPFEKSFFAGGANDLRAWLPRSLGPGSYQQSASGRVDQVGEIKLLGQAEYRFPIYGYLEGALFADFGNIWLSRPDPNRPQGEFLWDRFWHEFALGSGLGLRLNLGFFIFRADFAIPMRDPTQNADQRWVITRLKLPEDLRINIGIGYPF